LAYAYFMEQTSQQQPPARSVKPLEPKAPKGGSNSKKKLLISIGIVVGLLVLGGGVFAFTKLNKKEPQAYDNSKLTQDQKTLLNQDDPFTQQHLQGCKDTKVSFTHAPVPLEQMGYIIPMGQMSDGHVTPTDHVYVAPLNQSAADNTTDVVMPADGKIIGIGAMPAQYIGDKNQQVAPEDHRVIVQHNCQYVSIFIHIHQLSEKVQSAIGAKLKPNENKQLTLELKAGEKIGKIGGNPVDWTLADAKKKLSGFITPDLYKGESWKIHTIDPIAIYSGSLKDQLVAKSLRTTEPYGGKIDYDKKGALVGNWFREGTNGYMGASQDRYYDGHLAVAPHHVDPTATVVSMGNWQGKAAQLVAKAGAPDPAKVTSANGPVKYELTDISMAAPNGSQLSGMLVKGAKVILTGPTKGTVLFQVMDGEKLKFERFPGKTAAQVSGFTSAAQTYVR
jgi:hypothetical protein